MTGIKKLDIHALYRRYAFVKSKHWSYEREWRVWYPLADTNGQYDNISVRPSEFRALYIGCRASELFVDQAVGLLRQLFPGTRLFQAKKHEDTYALQYTEI